MVCKDDVKQDVKLVIMSPISLTSREAAHRFNTRVLIVTVSEEGGFKAPKGCPDCEAGCRPLGLGTEPDVGP